MLASKHTQLQFLVFIWMLLSSVTAPCCVVGSFGFCLTQRGALSDHGTFPQTMNTLAQERCVSLVPGKQSSRASLVELHQLLKIGEVNEVHVHYVFEQLTS